MLAALLILAIVIVVCVAMLIGTYMDNKRIIEREKLDMLKKNPDLFIALFNKDKKQK